MNPTNLTKNGFGLLLAKLDAAADRATEKYEDLRLDKYFVRSCGCPESRADDLADRTLDRVAQKLEREVDVENVRAYPLAAARSVWLERGREVREDGWATRGPTSRPSRRATKSPTSATPASKSASKARSRATPAGEGARLLRARAGPRARETKNRAAEGFALNGLGLSERREGFGALPGAEKELKGDGPPGAGDGAASPTVPFSSTATSARPRPYASGVRAPTRSSTSPAATASTRPTSRPPSSSPAMRGVR